MQKLLLLTFLLTLIKTNIYKNNKLYTKIDSTLSTPPSSLTKELKQCLFLRTNFSALPLDKEITKSQSIFSKLLNKKRDYLYSNENFLGIILNDILKFERNLENEFINNEIFDEKVKKEILNLETENKILEKQKIIIVESFKNEIESFHFLENLLKILNTELLMNFKFESENKKKYEENKILVKEKSVNSLENNIKEHFDLQAKIIFRYKNLKKKISNFEKKKFLFKKKIEEILEEDNKNDINEYKFINDFYMLLEKFKNFEDIKEEFFDLKKLKNFFIENLKFLKNSDEVTFGSILKLIIDLEREYKILLENDIIYEKNNLGLWYIKNIKNNDKLEEKNFLEENKDFDLERKIFGKKVEKIKNEFKVFLKKNRNLKILEKNESVKFSKIYMKNLKNLIKEKKKKNWG